MERVCTLCKSYPVVPSFPFCKHCLRSTDYRVRDDPRRLLASSIVEGNYRQLNEQGRFRRANEEAALMRRDLPALRFCLKNLLYAKDEGSRMAYLDEASQILSDLLRSIFIFAGNLGPNEGLPPKLIEQFYRVFDIFYAVDEWYETSFSRMDPEFEVLWKRYLRKGKELKRRFHNLL